MGGRDTHILAVFCDGSASDFDAVRLQAFGDLFVSQRMHGIFFLNHLFDLAFQNQQWRRAAAGALNRFREKVSKLVNALGSMGVFIRHGALTLDMIG